MAWQSPWYNKSKPERKMILGASESLGSFLTFGEAQGSTPASAILLYEKSTAVSVPINMIVDAFSIMEPILLIDDMVVDHEVIEFLKKPSPYYSGELLLETIGKDFLITGEMLCVALGQVNKPPLELQPISPARLTIGIDRATGVPSALQIGGATLNGIYVPKREGMKIRYQNGPLREAAFIRSYSTKDNSLIRGQSRLLSAAKEARQHILGTEHNVSLLEKGGRVSLVFHFKSDMDDEDFEEVKDRVRSQYGGSSEAGQIGVTSGEGLEIKDIGSTNRDMDFAVLHKLAQKSVALQYHVPLPLVSDERQTLNNYREGKIAIYDDAVIPLSRVIFGGLGNLLLPRWGLDPARARITFNPDQVSALVSRRNDEMKKRKDIGVETDNELRALMSREPYEGGDVVYKPSTMIPVGSDLFIEDNDPDLVESLDS